MRGRNRPIVIVLVALAAGGSIFLSIVTDVPAYLAWLGSWSVVTFTAYAIDKGQARRGGWRIPERTLHALSIAGGAIGGWVGLLALHHKTRHPVFPLVLAISLTVEVVLGFVLLG